MSSFDHGASGEDEDDVLPQRAKRSHTRGGPRQPRAPRWEIVPKGTPMSVCQGHKKPGGTCHAVIYWIERPRAGGKPGTARVPVDCDVEGGVTPDSLTDGVGVSHFATCPDAKNF